MSQFNSQQGQGYNTQQAETNGDLAQLTDKKITINRTQYEVIKKIGEGGFAYVYYVRTCKYDGNERVYCLKASSIQQADAKSIAEKEVAILNLCKRNNIRNVIEMHDSILQGTGKVKWSSLLSWKWLMVGMLLTL